MQDRPHQAHPSAPPQDHLPRWDLSALFPGKDSSEFENALAAIDRDVKAFAQDWRGRVGKADGATLGAAITRFEKISENIARVEAYVTLLRAADNREDAFAAGIGDRLRAAEQDLLFFRFEINAIPEPALLQKIAAPALAAYAPWLAAVRAARPHQLDEAAEKYRHLKEGAAEDAWRRLYDLTMQGLRFDVGGEKMTEAEVLNVIDNDRDPAQRRQAWDAFAKGLGDNASGFALIANTLAALKAAEDAQRGFENPEDSCHLENRIGRDTAAALAAAVKSAYAKTAHRYYGWKAKKNGVARLHPADRNAPLADAAQRYIPWEDAKEIVLSAFAVLSPEMAETGRRFFDEGWIDAAPRAGKDSGAFSHPAVPSAHPFILLNYFGTPADVMTLAHALGQGIHQVMAARQGHLMADAPLPVAEAAGVFGEMLVFRALLGGENDPVARRAMMAEKIEGMLNAAVRQTAFFAFERSLHAEYREKGELSPERLGALWREAARESLGPAVNVDAEGAQHFWACVPHFIHTPFYVCAYAFGECLADALHDACGKAPDKRDFAEKYAGMLAAGGSKSHEELLAAFGFDVNDPAFWRGGLGVIERYIDELLALDREIDLAAGADKSAAAGGARQKKESPANDDRPRGGFEKAARKKPPRAGLDAALPRRPPTKRGGTGGPS